MKNIAILVASVKKNMDLALNIHEVVTELEAKSEVINLVTLDLPMYTSILEDDKGNLWLSTGKGLSKFNIKNRTFSAPGHVSMLWHGCCLSLYIVVSVSAQPQVTGPAPVVRKWIAVRHCLRPNRERSLAVVMASTMTVTA